MAPDQENPPISLGERVHASLRNGLKVGVVSLCGLAGASLLAHRHSKFYRGFSFPAKCFFVFSGFAAITSIAAERHMVKGYYHSRNGGSHAQAMTPASWKDWLILNKYPMIGMVFAGTVALSTLYYWREKHMSASVRAMNIRLISQAATLAALVLGASVSGIEPSMVPRHAKATGPRSEH